MSLEEHPEIRKLSPSNYPDIPLQNLYEKMFSEIIQKGFNQSQAIQKVADKFNIHSSTVYFEIFPHKKLLHKNRNSWKWQYKVSHPNFSRKGFNEQRARKEKIRYHIDTYMRLAFEMTGYQTMELPQLADRINDMTDVRFRPSSLLTMSDQYQKKHNEPLLKPYKCHLFTQYGLNK